MLNYALRKGECTGVGDAYRMVQIWESPRTSTLNDIAVELPLHFAPCVGPCCPILASSTILAISQRRQICKKRKEAVEKGQQMVPESPDERKRRLRAEYRGRHRVYVEPAPVFAGNGRQLRENYFKLRRLHKKMVNESTVDFELRAEYRAAKRAYAKWREVYKYHSDELVDFEADGVEDEGGRRRRRRRRRGRRRRRRRGGGELLDYD